MRKLYIPFDKQGVVGGPATFMRNLRGYLDRSKFAYTTRPLFAAGIFFPVAFDLRAIRLVKLFGGKVIQRLDGIYYPSQHGEGYQLLNRDIERIYLHDADFVVFQSEYSRRQCFAMMGEKAAGEYAIIHNGADKEVFHPAPAAQRLDDKVRFAMSGNFRKAAMIEPVVKALDELRSEFDFEVTVAGPISGEGVAEFFKRDYIRMLGPQNGEQVAALLRGSHVFLHSQINDNCPNAVIEAVSCGLPVVGFDGGSMSELLPFSKDLLAYVSEDIFQKYEDYDYRRLKDKITLAVRDFEKYRKIALENSGRYDIEECGRQYVEVFKRVLTK